MQFQAPLGRRGFILGSIGAALALVGCGDDKKAPSTTKPAGGSSTTAGGGASTTVGGASTTAGAATGSTTAGTAGGDAAAKTLNVFGAYATAIEEPWDGVIHAALKGAQNIKYTHNDKLGYSGDMERTLREVCEKEKPDVIFGDAFGNEDAVRAVAKNYPKVAFAFGSGSGPSEPNVAVFDNWIHEPAYLAGMLAGGITKSGKLGIVAGKPVPEVNRLCNAFIAGAQKSRKDVEVKVTFINSWFDPTAAKEAALAQIGAGADVLYAERAGVIEAAKEKGLVAVGNMSDQSSIAPDSVLTSCVWSMGPTVEYVLKQVRAGTFTAQDLKDFSMMGKGGAALAPINAKLAPAELIKTVTDAEAQIKAGSLRVDIDENQPAGAVVNAAK